MEEEQPHGRLSSARSTGRDAPARPAVAVGPGRAERPPRRIYLDTATLQTLYDYGETLWDNEPFEPLRRDRQVPGLSDELDAPAIPSNRRDLS